MVTITKVRVNSVTDPMAMANFERGYKYYFGINPSRRISVYFKSKSQMLSFYETLLRRQKERDMYLTPIEKLEQHAYVLVGY